MTLASGWESESFSNPQLINDIIWENRSFSWEAIPAGGGTGILVPDAATPNFWDLEVFGTVAQEYLDPNDSVLTNTSIDGYGDPAKNNTDSDPEFVDAYHNAGRNSLVEIEFHALVGPMTSSVAFDEGGNFVDFDFGPVSLIGDYHIQATSSAATINGDTAIVAANTELQQDIDGDPRGGAAGPIDAGADEFTAGPGALCGLGFEAALILPLVQWSLRRRRRKTRICDGQPSLEELGQ
jgi:hypothetical protein